MPVDTGSMLQVWAGSCHDRFGDDLGYVDVVGELDGFGSSQIRESLMGLAAVTGDLVVDTNSVSFIDTAGLRLIEAVFARAAIGGNTVWLHDPSSVVTRLMALVGVTDEIATCIPGQAGERQCCAVSAASFSSCPPAARNPSGVSRPRRLTPDGGSPDDPARMRDPLSS